MFKLIIALFLLAGSIIGCNAQPALPLDVKDNIKERVDKGITPGIVVGLIEGDKTSYYAYGVKSVKGKEPVDENTVFEIGSISKTFTGILLADMVIKGKMKLDDPIQNYLPAGVTAPGRNGAVIKLVNLSNHSSSLPRMPANFNPANPANPFADYTEQQAYDFLKNYQLPRDIGSQYEYSNYAAGLLGMILARKNSKTYEELMVEIIAKPLGMEDTRIVFTPSMKKNLAIGHQAGAEVENWDIVSLAGAGGIRSTTVDMVKYVRANMGKLKSGLYPAIELSHKATTAAGVAPAVGLGWHMAQADMTEIIWHNGGTGGYRTFAGFVKNGNKGVVVMTNSNISIDDIGMHILNPSAPLTNVNPPNTSNVKEVEVDAKILETYVGKYELMPGFVITVARDGSQLKAQATAQPEFPVFARAENVFFYKVVEAQLTFNKSADGSIESLTLFQNGQQITGKRLKE